MNCVDLQRSLAGIEDLSTAEEQAHLKTCAACSALVAELDLIASSALQLRATEEPSPRVWNSIASALRQEGLIRPQAKRPFVVPTPFVPKPDAPRVTSRPVASRGVPARDIAASAASARGLSSFAAGWGWRGWLVPAAAVVLIAVGFFVNRRSLVHQLTVQQLARHIAPAASTAPAAQTVARSNVTNPNLTNPNLAGLDDDDLLLEIQNQSPAMRAQYVDNLRSANEYIQDAQSVVDANPNDEESRRSLLEAYQQKAMLFEMAMDRSLP
jgi:hypothetical protein